MLWSNPRAVLQDSQTPGRLAPGDPPVPSCLSPSPDQSAAPVIPTRTKSACTTAIWTSSGSTLPSALCRMECRATKDLSGADVPSVDGRLNTMCRRRGVALVSTPMPTLSARVSVCQAPRRPGRSGVSTESRATDDSSTSTSCPSSWVNGPFAPLWPPLHSLFGILPPPGTHSRGEDFGV